MAVPTTREEFKQFCLRKLGHPVIEINVDDDQAEDRIDESLRYFFDYHFDGSEKIYYKHKVTGKERAGAANTVTVTSGGTGYSNSDTLTFSGGTGAEFDITTYANGTINTVDVTLGGTNYSNTSVPTITTSGGSGANLSLIVGDGSIILPENILGAVSVFKIGDPSMRSDDMFNIRYQIALNDLYTLTNVSLVPYYMAMEHLALISEMLSPDVLIRYSRHKDKLFLDMDWSKIRKDEYLLVEAYEVVDPTVYSDVWSDRWLQNYATAKIKYQWGSNITKFIGMSMPGGVQFNGERILDDAKAEIDKMEQDMILNYSLPVMDMIG